MDEQRDLGWLIRDTSNRIRGPFKQAEILQLIQKGHLKGKTEISRANSYWFAIEEKPEIARFFPELSGGRPPPEQPTQMTATLTEADLQDHGIEVTTFTAVPSREELAGKGERSSGLADGISRGAEQIEWLSEELADEFGPEMGVSISVQSEASALTPQPGSLQVDFQEPSGLELPEEKTPPPAAPSAEEAAKQDMLRRATVKADALPSELRSFQGERPKPINTLMRNPEGKQGHQAGHHQAHATVNVPVEPEPAPKMFSEEEELKAQAARRSLILKGAAAVAVVLVAVAVARFVSTMTPAPPPPKQQPTGGIEAVGAAREAIILADLERARTVLAELVADPSGKSDAAAYLAQAVVKKEFYSDVEGAILALQMAKSVARDPRALAEVENLLGVYTFERDPATGAEMLRRNLAAHPEDPAFRYNLALGLVRSGSPQEAAQMLEGLLKDIPSGTPLAEDAAVALGWALDSHCSMGAGGPLCRRPDDVETAYARALESDPLSPKARLGIAIYRLRPPRGGIKGAEADFRSFLDTAPELERKARIPNYRLLGSGEFYAWAQKQVSMLNTPGIAMSKPSPLVMAADAVIQSILGYQEAPKILADAMQAAPGDPNLVKAQAYLYWNGGKYNEVVESLKEVKDRSGFAVSYLMAKALLKLHRREPAASFAGNVLGSFPARSEGHSLMGEVLLEQPGKTEEAKAAFHQALRRDPLDLIAWRGLQRAGEPIVLSPEIQRNLPF